MQMTTSEALRARPGPFQGREDMEREVVKELRAQVNDGLLTCRKALEEADWDVEAAKKILRQPQYPMRGCPR